MKIQNLHKVRNNIFVNGSAWHQLPNGIVKRINNKQIISNETRTAIVPNVC
jgi:hypothetical protein